LLARPSGLTRSTILSGLPCTAVLAGAQTLQLTPQSIDMVQRSRLGSVPIPAILRTSSRRPARNLLCLPHLIAKPLQPTRNLAFGAI